MNSFLFGMIFIQVSIFFIAAFLLLSIFYKTVKGRMERSAVRPFDQHIRSPRSRLANMI